MKRLIFTVIIFLVLSFVNYAWAIECRSDLNCSYGSKCIIQPYQSKGVCMVEVDKYGTKMSPGQGEVNEELFSKNYTVCKFDGNCFVGYKCDKQLKVCVKNR